MRCIKLQICASCAPGASIMERKYGRQWFMIALGLVLLLSNACEATHSADHAREFDVLCRFARIANGAASLTNATYLGSLAEWERVSKMEGELQDVIQKANGSSEPLQKVESEHFQLELGSANQRHQFLKLLGVVYSRIRKFESVVAELRRTAALRFSEARDEVLKALDGTTTGETGLTAAATSRFGTSSGSSRDTSCKAPKGAECGSSPAAGCDLLNDIMCLCAPGQDSNLGDEVCGVETGAAGTNHWYSTTMANLKAEVWDRLWANCKQRNGQAEFSTDSIEDALRSFRLLLGAHGNVATGDGNGVKMAWILGKPHTGGTCAGTSGNGVCVDYAKSAGGVLGEIMWMGHFKQARDKLREAEYLANKANHTILQASALLSNAEITLSTTEVFATTPQNYSIMISKSRQSEDQVPAMTPKAENKALFIQLKGMFITTALLFLKP